MRPRNTVTGVNLTWPGETVNFKLKLDGACRPGLTGTVLSVSTATESGSLS